VSKSELTFGSVNGSIYRIILHINRLYVSSKLLIIEYLSFYVFKIWFAHPQYEFLVSKLLHFFLSKLYLFQSFCYCGLILLY